ncbi:hypothetical protein OSTOST_04954, partial [Ostertagia ostertagi]
MAPVTDFGTNPRYAQEQTVENSNGIRPRQGHKIIINQSKKELFNIHSGLRGIHRRLKNAWTVETNPDEITDEFLRSHVVFNTTHPRAKFNVSEMEAIGRFITNGGAVLVLLSEGGEQQADTNINFLLEEFGIVGNSEALISNGVLNRSIAIAAKKNVSNDQQSNSQTISFVYPFGASLSVNRLSTPVLSTASTNGRLVVCGSVHMFCDQYIDKEENSKLFVSLRLLRSQVKKGL